MKRKNILLHTTVAFILSAMYAVSHAESVPRWSDTSITNGSISGASSTPGAYNYEQLKTRPVKAVFTYAVGGGNDYYDLSLHTEPTKTINLIRVAQVAESNKDATHPVPATFIINPDFLGEVHKSCQQYYCPIPYQTMTMSYCQKLCIGV